MATGAIAASARDLDDAWLDRDLSWLEFNRRVLQEALDERNPLLERVKFLAIFSSNLDEFFSVRMAGLRRQLEAGVTRRFPDGRTPRRTLADARARIIDLQSAQDRIWLDTLGPALAAERLPIVAVAECSPRELRALRKRFERTIEPLLTPIAVGPSAPFPYVPSLALNVGIVTRDPGTGERRFVRLNVPDDLPRFVPVGEHGAHVQGATDHFVTRYRLEGTPQREFYRVACLPVRADDRGRTELHK